MQTSLSAEFRDTPGGRQAEDILRNCVHCGFCNATCPTYELLGDELDGPRGRIYQMKQFLEGAADGAAMRRHLDRCLLCRNCETTCPSGVRYSRLLEISQSALDEKRPRGFIERLRRRLLTRIITHRGLFGALLHLGRGAKLAAKAMGMAPPLLAQVPERQAALGLGGLPTGDGQRRMIALAGCVQSALAANTNLAAAHVLGRLGITLFEVGGAGCCGGVALHTCGEARGRAAARRLIDRWLPHLEQGVEAIVMTASGCGVTVKEYPHLFEDDPEYRDKARRVSDKTVDLCELLRRELPAGYIPSVAPQKVAFHAPCTLQHGQRITGAVESVLVRAGHSLCAVRDSHLCCGSAGTYSLLQPAISAQLRRNKYAALTAEGPEVLCTANIGCQIHLAAGADRPVVHWVELLL
ncbi:MAG: glycolate oxidase subunit GlcF [Gammaproteobacteria bacterium]|nr:glycolate oxidase subunit GlcF [Gammaproteobacteria bacterium]